jgi:putative nucleotidyltransferase with HDIG domain
VADLAEGIAEVLGMAGRRLRRLRRAALLHDIGKLGVSNLILDKPGKLDADELTIMRRHPAHTYEVLRRVKAFSEFAELAAGHHERLDGRGYHKGISGSGLGLEVRILAVADFYEALAARRPYRQDLTREEAITIIERDAGKGCCPSVVSALKTFLSTSQFAPHQVQAAA